MVGLGVPGAVAVTVGWPAISLDGMGKNNGDTSSVSPSPYEFTGIVRGRRSGTVEKVVEQRQRRLIKNRESAARPRARKQAYTMELEAEVVNAGKPSQIWSTEGSERYYHEHPNIWVLVETGIQKQGITTFTQGMVLNHRRFLMSLPHWLKPQFKMLKPIWTMMNFLPCAPRILVLSVSIRSMVDLAFISGLDGIGFKC
ncbi:putative transcription factor bZIP family [Helianthus annuus]|nr:putative transcription factor bZIP family [Helianthus annuus]